MKPSRLLLTVAVVAFGALAVVPLVGADEAHDPYVSALVQERAVRAALALTKTPSAPPAAAGGAGPGLDTARLASALGYAGKVTGGVYQVSVSRAQPVRMAGMEIPPAMGVATALNFQPTGKAKAAITGDFVLTADEVNPVIKALRAGGIAVTALHSHMLGEEPRLYFMHFWANDDAVGLARTLH